VTGSQTTTRGIFKGRCALCGAYTAGDYCYAHAWAGNRDRAGSELARATSYRQGFRDGFHRHLQEKRNNGSPPEDRLRPATTTATVAA
jgi:hypothetical protein